MSKEKKSKVLNISLWIAQFFLAIIFLMAGMLKAFQPIDEMAKVIPWVLETPMAFVRFIGISELLGAVSLLIPSIFRIRPKLTAYAAFALLFVLISGLIFHVMRGEYAFLSINVVLGLVAWFVGWGRLKKLPITSK